MQRKFEPFNQSAIISELLQIPRADRARLFLAMEAYQNSGPNDPRPAVVNKYSASGESDVLRLKHADSKYQGRLLFYQPDSGPRHRRSGTYVLLISLLVYKKEGTAVPARHLTTARQRMRTHQRRSAS